MANSRTIRWLHKFTKLLSMAKRLCPKWKWRGNTFSPPPTLESKRGAVRGAPGFPPEEAYLRNLVETVRKKTGRHQRAIQKVNGKIWVTAEGVRSSGIASVWVIKRFIDPKAHIKLIPPAAYRTAPGELSFGMADADYADSVEKCTFEVLVESFNLSGKALTTLSEVIHDITIGDDKFRNNNTKRIKTLLSGIILTHDGDSKRLERSFAILDEFYNHYSIKNP